MDRNQPYGRPSRDRHEEGYGRQPEQFADRDYGYGDEDRDPRQMGEGASRGAYGQFDNDTYGSGYGASAGRQSFREERERGRYGQDPGGYARGSYGASGGSGRDRQRGSYSGHGRGEQSSVGYGPLNYSNRDHRGFDSFDSDDDSGRNFGGPRRDYGSDYSRSGNDEGYGRSNYGAGNYGARGRSGGADWDDRSRREERGFFERAGDEVASWFGDEEAARRRENDHSGRGPANYTRSDERILEDACDHLTRDRDVDARNIQVTVQNAEITLDGTVPSRQQKRRAEDCVYDLPGVKHVQNNLRVQDRDDEWARDRQSRRGGDTDQNTSNRSDSTTGTLA